MAKNQRVVITGAGGFIGSHLAEAYVRAGAQVTAITHYNSASSIGNLQFVDPKVRGEMRILAGNIEDSDFVYRALEGHDVALHLAALIAIPYSYEAPRSYLRANIEGTLNVLEATRRSAVGRTVHTSTSEVYGTALRTPIDETHPLQGQSPYSASKISADKLAESYYLSFSTPVVTMRPFNTFGPRQSARAFIPTIISQALSQPAVSLGSLTPERDAGRRGQDHQSRHRPDVLGRLVRRENSLADGRRKDDQAGRAAHAPGKERGAEARLRQRSRPRVDRLEAEDVAGGRLAPGHRLRARPPRPLRDHALRRLTIAPGAARLARSAR
jgi:dTDP-4-dehydrorhamnose reductase